MLLLVSLLSWYVGTRTAWAFRLPRRLRYALAATIVAGIASAVLARTLGHAYANIAAPLGAFGSAVVLSIVISSLLLIPVEAGRLLAALFRGLRRRFKRAVPEADDAPAAPARRAFVAQVASAGAISLGVGASLYGTVIGRRDYTVETVPIRLAKLPRTLDGFTIVQLSDIHVGTFVGEHELSRARELVRDARPDLVVMTGDLLDHDLHYAPTLARFARSLRSHARHGVYAIPGNHDHYAGAPTVLRRLREAGTEVLLNRNVRIGSGRDAFVLAGIDDVAGARFGSEGPRLEQAFADAPEELARVLLSHNPVYFPHSFRHADLTLSGHTHGGQITLFINPAELVLRHGLVRGHYDFDGSQLYVNRGFGTAGPPTRVGSPPEITRLVLTT